MMSDPAPIEASGKPAPSAAVLIVDDDPAQRLTIRTILAPLGHVLVEADSGRAALRAVLQQSFAVILMDVHMPTMDGFETAKLIRGRSQSELTPVIFVTAFGRDETETASAYADGAVDFIFTPILPDVLRAKVSVFVDLFVQAEELQRSLSSITALNGALRDSEVHVRAVLHNVADGIMTAGETGLIESFNPSAQRLFGYSEDQIIGRPLRSIVAPDRREEFSQHLRTRHETPAETNGAPPEPSETVGCRRNGTHFAMEMDLSQMRIDERTLTIGCVRDVSGRKAYMEALEQRSLHDDLTGLPNRTLFSDRMAQAFALADRADEPIGVLVINLDRFAKINAAHGRTTGDALLREVTERLRGVTHDSDSLGRLGGNEFGILPAAGTDVETAAAIAWKVRAAIDEPFSIAGLPLSVQASIGMALFPDHGRATGDLLRRANLAAHKAKRSGSGLAVYSTGTQDQTACRLILLNELRHGIAHDELVLHFQPKVDLRTRQTIGVEALVRWRHPTDGLLPPARFVPEAEYSDLIEPLTRWVLAEALQQQRIWRDAGRDLTMAVNVSARSLARDSSLPDTVAELTRTWDIAADRLILELTENAMIDENAPATLATLHEMGERLAIDDFGTGHSSLLHLQRLPIDEIKIDRSFVMNLASIPADAVIVRSTIDLAHNLGLTVVAEGVEDEATLDMLVEYGCDNAQGYLFSHPRSAEDLTSWLSGSAFGC